MKIKNFLGKVWLTIKGLLLSIRSFLENNKNWLEPFAAILLGIMAITVSISQCSISEKEKALLEQQTQLSQKQYEVAKMQIEFLYTPNLEVEFSTPAEFDLKMFLKNEGNNVLKDIRIRIHTGLLNAEEKRFSYISISGNDWKTIDSIKSGKQVEVSLNNLGLRGDMDFLNRYKKLPGQSKRKNTLYNFSSVIKCFLIRFKCGPDLKEYTIKRYVDILEDLGTHDITLMEIGEYLDESERINLVRSLGIYY